MVPHSASELPMPASGLTSTSSGFRTLVAALALPVLASACVPADATSPRLEPTLGAAFADVAHPALDWPSRFFSGAGVVAPAILPSRCPFDATSQFFVCSPLTGNGLTLNQRFTLQNASGGRQSAFDPATTSSLHLENAVTGTPSDDQTVTVDGQQVLDLTGLGTQQHTLNGTSLTLATSQTSNSQPPAERRTTITDLVIPVVAAGAPTSWPLSGTIDTRSRSISTSGDTTVFIATMRFDGSSIVTLTMTVAGGLRTCRVNIAMLAPGVMGCVGPDTPPLGADAVPRATSALR
jgi:hypothetical protein